MILIKYVDLYDSYYTEDGELEQELIQENFSLPVDINESDIISVSPFFSKKGKLFKNVSIIEDRYGKTYKVVGNYKKLKQSMDTPQRKQIGYGK